MTEKKSYPDWLKEHLNKISKEIGSEKTEKLRQFRQTLGLTFNHDKYKRRYEAEQL